MVNKYIHITQASLKCVLILVLRERSLTDLRMKYVLYKNIKVSWNQLTVQIFGREWMKKEIKVRL